MGVYVLFHGVAYEGTEVLGIFEDLDVAIGHGEKYAEEREIGNGISFSSRYIEIYEIEMNKMHELYAEGSRVLKWSKGI